MYAYRIREYIGTFTAVLNGLDAIVFIRGVGENDPPDAPTRFLQSWVPGN